MRLICVLFTFENNTTPTDKPKDGPTDRRTDKTSYRDATAHLKREEGGEVEHTAQPYQVQLKGGGGKGRWVEGLGSMKSDAIKMYNRGKGDLYVVRGPRIVSERNRQRLTHSKSKTKAFRNGRELVSDRSTLCVTQFKEMRPHLIFPFKKL